jgi:hypothetical protein
MDTMTFDAEPAPTTPALRDEAVAASRGRQVHLELGGQHL